MSSTNQSPEYQKAQGRFLCAQTDEERTKALEEMIRECPKHKSSEKMLANLKTRYKKLKLKIVRDKKAGKGGKKGIKKEDMQAVIIGFTNTGKSTLLKLLTNATPTISQIKFTTKEPVIGMLNYDTVQIQLIENPAIESPDYDKGLTNGADTLLILINRLEEIDKIKPQLKNTKAKRIIVFNTTNQDKNELRKIDATLKSKKHNYVIINLISNPDLDKLKKLLFQTFEILRIYTKEPGKPKSDKPMILKPDSTVSDAAEKILTGLSKRVIQTKIWGPSSKFAGQIVGLKHILKDLDVVEFKTK